MADKKLYYFCESDFIAQKIKETARLLTSNEEQRAPNGKKLRFVSFEAHKLNGEERSNPAVILDRDKLNEKYRLEPHFFSAELDKAKIKYVAAYEDQSFNANILTVDRQFTISVTKEIYNNLKRQILDMSESDKEKYKLEIFGRGKTKSNGSLRTEMFKFNVRRGGLSLSRDITEQIEKSVQTGLDDEFRIWTDADTIDVSGCIIN